MIIYTPDSARYLAWANSLAKFEGFKDSTAPEPTHYVVHAPLYSVSLMPSALIFSNNIIAAKATTLIFGILLIFTFYLWLKRRSGEKIALISSALLALNPLMMIYSTQILSDVPFALCLILFFLYTERIAHQTSAYNKIEYILIAIVATSVFMRDIGMTVMLGAIFFFLWKKNYRLTVLVCLISLCLYALWFIRNEIIIAGEENPTIRNSRIFFTHLYTTQQASLVSEFALRFWNNFLIYTESIGKLIFMPDFSERSLSLISLNNPIVSIVFRILPSLKIFIMVSSLGLFGIGCWREWKERKSFLLLLSFLICYFIPILLYPINDQRFLFPLLLILIYLCASGMVYSYVWWISKIKLKGAGVIILSGGLLLFVPNIAWLQSYVINSSKYGHSPEQLFDQFKNESEYPAQFTKPLHLAGKWIVEHSRTQVNVLSRWKELAFSLGEHKVVEAFPQITPNAFEYLLRDYSIKYIVAVMTRVGLNEFEGLINRSNHYTFNSVYRVADVEVLEVVSQKEQKVDHDSEFKTDLSVCSLYRQALNLIEVNPERAEQLLKEIPIKVGGYSEIVFQIGVAKEFAGELDSAVAQFEKFRLMPQAGGYIQLASQHFELISRLKKAISTEDSVQRAEDFQLLAVFYWELGYRKRANEMLHRAFKANKECFPALVVSTLYSLQQGDTAAAWSTLNNLRSIQSDNLYTKSLLRIEQCIKSIQNTSNRESQIELRLNIVKAYLDMNLPEYAINDLMELQDSYPPHQKVLMMLGRLLETKQRYHPALRCYEKILYLDPTNKEILMKANELIARL